MKKNKLILLLIALSFIGTLIIYNYLPNEIAFHWNTKGQPNNYGSKWLIFITGIIPIFMYFLFNYLPKIDPKKDNYSKHSKSYNILKLIILLFLILIHWLSIIYNFNIPINITLFTKLLVGILFVIIGNYMPQFRQNFFVGIKTPWTLSNETVWKKAHRYGGYVFIICGFLFILTAFLNNSVVNILIIITIIILISSTFIYSYLVYKKL